MLFEHMVKKITNEPRVALALQMLGTIRREYLPPLAMDMFVHLVENCCVCAQAVADEEGMVLFVSFPRCDVWQRLQVVTALLNTSTTSTTSNTKPFRAFLNFGGIDLLEQAFSQGPNSAQILGMSKCLRTIARSRLDAFFVTTQTNSGLLRLTGELLSQVVATFSTSMAPAVQSVLNRAAEALLEALRVFVDADEETNVTYSRCAWNVLKASTETNLWQPSVLCQACNVIESAKGDDARITYALIMTHSDRQVFIEAWMLHARLLVTYDEFAEVNNSLDSRQLAERFVCNFGCGDDTFDNYKKLFLCMPYIHKTMFVDVGGIEKLVSCLHMISQRAAETDQDVQDKATVCNRLIESIASYASEALFWDKFGSCNAVDVLDSFSTDAAKRLVEQFAQHKATQLNEAQLKASLEAKHAESAEHAEHAEHANQAVIDQALADAKQAQSACLEKDNQLNELHAKYAALATLQQTHETLQRQKDKELSDLQAKYVALEQTLGTVQHKIIQALTASDGQ